jgi:hypothetical protein
VLAKLRRVPEKNKNQKLFTLLGVAYLSINILLTITDQFGILDLITLILDIILLVLLIVLWRR